ncbi:MAG TPA: TRAP transporter large permease subunit [Burkholderiaceae bacterium]|nr:TRAP transporter large permease subunit [Burkholderiaceae bacterium]
MSDEILGLVLLGLLFVVILGGFPISFTLIFLAMVFGYIGLGDRVFHLMTYQVFGTMMDTVLAAVAMFTFMGYVLESAGLMRRLFHAVQLLCGRLHGSLYLATILTATLFAAATGIVGASVTIIALMAAPVMLKAGYDVKLSAGTICAGGTLGILIPPSVMLVVMGPVLQVSVARLYSGALLPGLLLASLYLVYTGVRVWLNPKLGPPLSEQELDVPRSVLFRELFFGLIPPAALILVTLGSIVSGWATPTEGAALGCAGALVVTAAHGKLTWAVFKDSVYRTVQTSSMVMILLVASTFMGSVFSALGTPTFIAHTLVEWNIPPTFLILAILVVCFILGWPLEWVPIVVIIVPIFMPIMQLMKIDMVWFSILLAVTLQTCWLSPPVALSAYYLKGVMPKWDLADIYKGMLPFMALQWVAVLILYFFPQIILVLPNMMFGTK